MRIGATLGVLDPPDHDEVLLEHAPGRELDLVAADRELDDVLPGQGAELAATIEVGGDHRGHVGVRRQAGALEGEGHHRDRQRRGVAVDEPHANYRIGVPGYDTMSH